MQTISAKYKSPVQRLAECREQCEMLSIGKQLFAITSMLIYAYAIPIVVRCANDTK